MRLENGEVVKIQKLEDRYFGEGIAIVGDSIVQLTWKSEVGFVYDRNTFQRTKTFNYPGEGWGLTFDGKRLIMSDGSATLTLPRSGVVEGDRHVWRSATAAVRSRS